MSLKERNQLLKKPQCDSKAVCSIHEPSSAATPSKTLVSLGNYTGLWAGASPYTPNPPIAYCGIRHTLTV